MDALIDGSGATGYEVARVTIELIWPRFRGTRVQRVEDRWYNELLRADSVGLLDGYMAIVVVGEGKRKYMERCGKLVRISKFTTQIDTQLEITVLGRCSSHDLLFAQTRSRLLLRVTIHR